MTVIKALIFVALATVILAAKSPRSTRWAALLDPGDVMSSSGVYIEVKSSHDKRRIRSDGHVDWYDMDIEIEGEKVAKRFHKLAERSDVQSYKITDEGVVEDDDSGEVKRREWAVYGAGDNRAAVLVKRAADNTSRLLMEGSFYHKGHHYLIQPVHESPRHVIHKIGSMPDIDPILIDNLRVKRGDSRTFRAEAFIMFDYELYKVWEKVTPSGESTKELIKEYYGLLINEINFRYTSLERWGYKFRIVMGGLSISTDANNPPYNVSHFVNGENTKNNEYWLNDYSKWVNKNLPGKDVVQLHSGYRCSGSTLGIAYIGRVCDTSNSGLVADDMDFLTVVISAHEFGHNFKMSHDSTKCFEDRNIMYPQLNSPNNYKDINKWLSFSSCNIKNLTDQIGILDKNNNNCLLKKTADVTHLNRYGKKWPGADLTLDQQCNRMIKGSRFCSEKQRNYPIDNICTEIWCTNPKYPTKFDRCIRRFSYPGTTCGDGKVCLHAKCITHAMGKRMDEACPWGEVQHGFIGSKKLTCTQGIAGTPTICHKHSISCCKQCPKLLIKDKPNCKYGDFPIEFKTKAKTYTSCPEAVRAFSGVCYTKHKKCCLSCPPLLDTAHPKCNYGDKVSYYGFRIHGNKYRTCKEIVNLETGVCYNHHKTCCKSCGEVIDSSKPTCKYGDHIVMYGIRVDDRRYMFCADAVRGFPGVCYIHNSTCCKSCTNIDTSAQANCKYKDQPGNVVLNSNGVLDTCANVITNSYYSMCYHTTKCCHSCGGYRNDTNTNCQYGNDITKKFKKNNVLMNCNDAIRSGADKGLCYSVENLCCKSCPQYADNTNSECKYGDKLRSGGVGQCSHITPRNTWSCYHDSTRCCETCAQYFKKDQPKSCEFGDKEMDFTITILDTTYTRCEEAVKASPSACYHGESICCLSCPNHKNPAKVNCEYGDRAFERRVSYMGRVFDDCASVVNFYNGYCYKSSQRHICCETCAKVKKPQNIDCEYGDKPSYKGNNQCSDITSLNTWECYFRDRFCCATCKSFFQSQQSTSCRYGDHKMDPQIVLGKTYSRCEKAVVASPGVCYNVKYACCLSCSKVEDTQRKFCEYGDRPFTKRLRYLGRDFSDCASVVSYYPGYCYAKKGACCKSCREAKERLNTGIDKCDYGDKRKADGTDICSMIKASNRKLCYGYPARYDCCQTCPGLVITGAPSDCLHGDRDLYSPIVIGGKSYNTCATAFAKSSGICYRYFYDCCLSCFRIVDTTKPNCQYGDYLLPSQIQVGGKVYEDCPTVVSEKPYYCYNKSDRKNCCRSCGTAGTGEVGCEYGDNDSGEFQFQKSDGKWMYASCPMLRDNRIDKTTACPKYADARKVCCKTCKGQCKESTVYYKS